jgi:hypothetical protein
VCVSLCFFCYAGTCVAVATLLFGLGLRSASTALASHSSGDAPNLLVGAFVASKFLVA